MIGSLLRRFGRNLSTLLLAFVLAVVVWVSAVMASDPNQELPLAQPVTLEIVGQDPGLLLMGNTQSQVQLRLNAPRSVWSQLNSSTNAIRVWVDLTAMKAGTYTVPVHVQKNIRPVQIVRYEPAEVEIKLENLVTQNYPISLRVTGQPAQGYDAGIPTYDHNQVTISGPESLTSRVQQVRATLDISQKSETIQTALTLQPVDADGNLVTGITLTPRLVTVTQPINLRGGMRNVIVKVITQGQVASGYKLTNIYVNPPNLVVFSTDPQVVLKLPGYVNTQPIDLTDAKDYIEIYLDLDLPEDISIVGDPKVLVQVSITALEDNIKVSLPVEISGLMPGLVAQVAPETVDVILTGPVPVLKDLIPSNLRLLVDLTGLTVGTYTLEPTVELLPPDVDVVSILSPNVEVTISLAPTYTPTPTLTPTTTRTPTRTPTPTSTPGTETPGTPETPPVNTPTPTPKP
jgi:YbbR domain-containing protein